MEIQHGLLVAHNVDDSTKSSDQLHLLPFDLSISPSSPGAIPQPVSSDSSESPCESIVLFIR